MRTAIAIVWSLTALVGQQRSTSPTEATAFIEATTRTVPDSRMKDVPPWGVSGRFSPDGRQFAFTNHQRAWIYDAATQQTTSPFESQQHVDTAWSQNNELYARTSGNVQFFRISKPGTSETVSPPDDVLDTFRRQDLEQPANGGERQNDQFEVTINRQPHGINYLLVRRLGKPGVRRLASGSWELESYLFDGERSIVMYPADDAIVLANLQTLRAQTLWVPNARNLRLLDKQPNARVIAYSVTGSCEENDTISSTPSAICLASW